MTIYEMYGPMQSPEEILRAFGSTNFEGGFPNATNYVLTLADVRSHAEGTRSQQQQTEKIVTAVDRLTTSINRASEESGALSKKVVWLTRALVAVGIGQIVATAWPYLAWWWYH